MIDNENADLAKAIAEDSNRLNEEYERHDATVRGAIDPNFDDESNIGVWYVNALLATQAHKKKMEQNPHLN